MVNVRRFSLFLLLSVTDLSLTWYLLHNADGKIYESNPVARWFLDAYGWTGMAALKGGTVLVAAGIAYFLAARKPQLSEGILTIGCLVLLGVVGYSTYLVSVVRFNLDPDLALLDHEAKRDESIQRSTDALRTFCGQRDQLVAKLARNQISLPAAADQLSRAAHFRDAGFRRGLILAYGPRPWAEYMAICLVEHTLQQAQGEPSTIRNLAASLVEQFHAAYDREPPWSAAELVRLVQPNPRRQADRLAVSNRATS